jgi:hypothetical protein
MTKQTIGIGSTANDGNGDPLRTAFDKANDNFTELYDIVPNVEIVDTSSAPQSIEFNGIESEQKLYRRSGANTMTITSGAGKTFAGGGTEITANVDGAGVLLMLSGAVIEILSTN